MELWEHREEEWICPLKLCMCKVEWYASMVKLLVSDMGSNPFGPLNNSFTLGKLLNSLSLSFLICVVGLKSWPGTINKGLPETMHSHNYQKARVRVLLVDAVLSLGVGSSNDTVVIWPTKVTEVMLLLQNSLEAAGGEGGGQGHTALLPDEALSTAPCAEAQSSKLAMAPKLHVQTTCLRRLGPSSNSA